MKILMGVDDSRYAADILRAITTQRRPENTEVLVLHVLQPVGPPPPQMSPGYAPELEAERQAAHALVERIATELRAAGFQAKTLIGVGDIREGILDAATEWHADLIMVGSHGLRGVQRFLLGGVPEFVVRHAPCSVEIVRTPPVPRP
jgi:nucleotide-binding universal stress UspA family protein